MFETEININLFAPLFYVSDRKAMIDYYEKLGLYYENSSGASMSDGFNLFFKQAETGQESMPNEMFYGKKTFDIIAYVRGIDSIYESYKRAGSIIYQPLTINEDNCKQFLIKDPGGYTTKFIQPVDDSNRPKIFFSAKVFYITNVKQTLDYYQSIGFNCKYDSGLTIRDEIKIIFYEVPKQENSFIEVPDLIDIYAGVEFGLETLYEELKNTNALFVFHLRKNNDGKNEFCIKDPAGHKILFIDF